jgi:hypothetical protein
VDAFEQVAVAVEEGAVDPGAASDVGDVEFLAVFDGVVERGEDALAASGGVRLDVPGSSRRRQGRCWWSWGSLRA